MTRQEIESALSGIEFTRKPDSFEDVETIRPALTLSAIKSLPVFSEKDVLKKGLAGNFTGDMPQYFLLKGLDKNTYLIDTQGYDYPRYMVRVEL